MILLNRKSGWCITFKEIESLINFSTKKTIACVDYLFLPQSPNGYQMSRTGLCNMIATMYMQLSALEMWPVCIEYTVHLTCNTIFQRLNIKMQNV